MTRPRVVITGVAGITPLANDIENTWKKLIAGESGIAPITLFDASAYNSRIAGEVKNFAPETFMPPKQVRRMDRFTQFAVASAKMLLEDAGFAVTQDNAFDTAVILGIGLGGLHTIETWHAKLLESGPGKVSPFMIPMLISNMGPGQVSIFTGAKGPNIVTTTACASGIHAVGTAYGEILLGRVTAAITGGVEATVTPLGVAGFTALKALSTRCNDEPGRASRPFDAARDGFVISEGAGLVLVESLEKARVRGAKIYAEVIGYGASGDAWHMTAPREDGEGMARAMQNALREAGLAPSAITHINAHATSTQLNDVTETKAIKLVFGEHAKKIKISATKSMTGHLLGAAGGIESVFTALALYEEILPGTINLEHPDPQCDLDYLPDGSQNIACEYAMCNSFGFGGTNASLIFKKWDV
ncbi:beta-ketoacyl-ACP synthase II [Candidatus Desulfovibrio trichonymphae]|uniref:3-oxoacyl-[acyl-carrier-protein] synthase 2 n=1 Tax=Candidatus Desulfovibrio trichonymphae TaxID=1725232 RepID=A0A1J1DR94_9BACT|nr:beta-ketoacyl-ACP synthase II [Candidatus Desulfovibrio trichonymphae]BAV92354.1 3-oxoacyl-[acyl-carrier-protein] synthase 2 [Candidatus Desulfovibrio trichonymphae]GHU98046.1 3-oxoacyl-[acyl-carrier-protein] synthase 2 [Deltaproteobacteria bacterium]